MRDAFGGVFMTNLFLVFIFIYVAFTAVSLNYAKAYRVKNHIIDFVEQSEIKNLDEYFGTGVATKDKSKLDAIIANASYHKNCSITTKTTIYGKTGYCYKGVIFLKVENQAAETKIVLKDSNGKEILSCEPELDYQLIVLSSPDIKKGETYTLNIGESSREITAN